MVPIAFLAHLLFFIRYVDGREHFSVQSNDGDLASSFSSGMVFDPLQSRVYITGSTFGNFFDPGTEALKEKSNCFMAILQLPIRRGETDPVWLRRVSIGQEGQTDACSSIEAAKSGSMDPRFYLTGYSEKLDETAGQEESHRREGFVLDMSWFGKLQGGYMVDDAYTQYPQISTKGTENDDFYVATLLSRSGNDSFLQQDGMRIEVDNTMAGAYDVPGGHFSALVHRVSRSKTDSPSTPRFKNIPTTSFPGISDVGFSQIWRSDLNTSANVKISNMILLPGERRLVVAGSITQTQDTEGVQKVYVSVIDTGTGHTIKDIDLPDSLLGKNKAFGLCRQEGESKGFFIVGTTNGDLYPTLTPRPSVPPQPTSFQAFILKIDDDTFAIDWTYQLGAIASGGGPTHVDGLSCAVSPDGSLVYMAGNVRDGSSITINGTDAVDKIQGGDDIFVSQLHAKNGSLVYARQIGTEQDDRLAAGNGIATDLEGNAIVLGNTRGSLFREKRMVGEGLANDIVVFSVDRSTGEFGKTAATSEKDDSGPPLGGGSESEYSSERPRDSSGESDQESPETQYSSQRSSSQVAYIVSIILLSNTIMAGFLFLRYSRRQNQSKSAKIIDAEYSQGPSIESDVDVDTTGSHTSEHGDENLFCIHNTMRRGLYTIPDNASGTSGTTLRVLPREFVDRPDTFLQLEMEPDGFLRQVPGEDGENNSRSSYSYSVSEEESPAPRASIEGEDYSSSQTYDEDAQTGIYSLISDISRQIGLRSRNRFQA